MQKWRHQKLILEERLRFLNSRLHSLEDQLDTPHSKDAEDFAQEVEHTEVLEELGIVGQQEIKLIQTALKNIKKGSYGICANCSEPISMERLNAIPYAAVCRNCMNKG
ncbi:TraR/DksA family transcriptional regulator [Amylibacter sp. SFDW26]|uniref:TraR/DksA family transcriptional regulator n=1 Tax=Amylibacter sp. SFDW26 TaxID=2652722 RepID=UPI0012613BF4|nr:TraR/DksA family transcriptional regulator [Amylibacter sp. SFDW26]KAB7614434.1 TraR/DksA family transcriptional regulator [Amylibacter sp. SFDW26]